MCWVKSGPGMQCALCSSPALALKNLPLPSGVSKVKREHLALLRVLCLAEAPATEDDLTSSSLLVLLCSAALLGKWDQVRFKSLENGLLFLSVLIKVKTFCFLVWCGPDNKKMSHSPPMNSHSPGLLWSPPGLVLLRAPPHHKLQLSMYVLKGPWRRGVTLKWQKFVEWIADRSKALRMSCLIRVSLPEALGQPGSLCFSIV